MYTLGHIPNCNFRARFQQWQDDGGTLRGNRNIGCGLNSLAFLGIFTRQQANALLDMIDPNGTTFQQMINYVYAHLQGLVPLLERRIPLTTEQEVQQFFNILLQDLPDNSCTVVKYLRYPENIPRHMSPPCNGIQGLTSGHSVIFSKNGNSITSIDPQQMNIRENIDAAASFPYLQRHCFVEVSLIYGFTQNIQPAQALQVMQYPVQEDVDMPDLPPLAFRSTRKVRKSKKISRKTSKKTSRKTSKKE
jgi:hypothetical protein